MLDIGRCLLFSVGYWALLAQTCWILVLFAGGLDAYEGPSSSGPGVKMAAAAVDKGGQLADGSRINSYRFSVPGCSRLTLSGLHVKVADLTSSRHRGAPSTLPSTHIDTWRDRRTHTERERERETERERDRGWGWAEYARELFYRAVELSVHEVYALPVKENDCVCRTHSTFCGPEKCPGMMGQMV
jgi:hypothetical protein